MRGKFVLSAVAAGVAMAAPANADNTDSIFVSVLDEEGIFYTTASDAILVAKGVCVFLNEGNSLTDATLQVKKGKRSKCRAERFLCRCCDCRVCPSQSP